MSMRPAPPNNTERRFRHVPVETRRRLLILRALTSCGSPTVDGVRAQVNEPTLLHELNAAGVPTDDAELAASIDWLNARKLVWRPNGRVALTDLGRLVERGAVIDGALSERPGRAPWTYPTDTENGVEILDTAIRDLRRRNRPASAALLGLVLDIVAGRPIADELTRADLHHLFDDAADAIREAAPTRVTD